MMEFFKRTTFRAAVIFCMCGELLPTSTSKATIPADCIMTVNTKRGIQSKKLFLVYVNASNFPETPPDSLDLSLELCQNTKTLKISWRMKKGLGVDIMLCYKMKAMYNGELLNEKCVKFSLEFRKRSPTVTCWFPMEYIAYRPIITAAAEANGHDRKYDLYGELNTSGLDRNNACGSKDICDVATLKPTKSLISCDDTLSVFFDEKVTIEAVWFDGIDPSLCQNSPVIMSGLTSKKLDYSLNCRFHGLGKITIVFSIYDRLCRRHHRVRVECDNVPTTAIVSTTTESDAEDLKTLIAFGGVCMIVVAAIGVIIYFVAHKLKLIVKNRRRSKEINRANRSGSESLPFTENNLQQEGNVT